MSMKKLSPALQAEILAMFEEVNKTGRKKALVMFLSGGDNAIDQKCNINIYAVPGILGSLMVRASNKGANLPGIPVYNLVKINIIISSIFYIEPFFKLDMAIERAHKLMSGVEYYKPGEPSLNCERSWISSQNKIMIQKTDIK